MNGTILIVDDEVVLARAYVTLLQRQGYQAIAVHSAAAARVQMRKSHPDVVLMDIRLPDGDGVELIGELKQAYRDTIFIIVSAYGSIRSAVEATKKGASDFLTKPVAADEVYLTIENALKQRLMNEEVTRLRAMGDESGTVSRRNNLGTYPSQAMQQVLEDAEKAARQDGIVLLLGESGTGKDVLARRIHRASRRRDGPFFSINCAALSRDLAEAELFGHEPGAFTGARGRKRGLLELAENGSLLLDEVGELDPALQAKLLSFLDTREIMRVGGERPIKVHARLLAATNRDLAREVERGRFRKDLYYRLNVFPIRLPPLRERKEDIEYLVYEILDRLVEDLGLTAVPKIEPEVFRAFQDYDWPGNVRELRNVLERAVMLSSDGVVRARDLSLQGLGGEWKMTVPFPRGESLQQVTSRVAAELIKEALRRGKTRAEAARLLGITRDALNYRMRALGLSSSNSG